MIDYSKYPPNWKSEIVPRILARAHNRCEECNAPNHKYRVDADGISFYHSDPQLGSTRIVLTVHHLDNDPENWDVSDDRLIALCQRCHLSKHRGGPGNES